MQAILVTRYEIINSSLKVKTVDPLLHVSFFSQGPYQICGVNGMLCVENATVYQPKFKQCLPACDELEYSSVISSAPLIDVGTSSAIEDLAVIKSGKSATFQKQFKKYLK